MIFNIKCPIMPHTTLQCLRTVTQNDICSDLICLQSQWFLANILWNNISRKGSDEASIFSMLLVYESISEGFSFSVTLKADFRNNVLLHICSLAETCFIEIRALLLVTLLKELQQVRFQGISRTSTLFKHLR